AGPAAVQVQMRIFDKAGNLVFVLTATAGQPAATGVAYLAAGSYTVSYVAVAQNGALTDDVTFSLKGEVVTDPLSPTLVGSTSTTSLDTSPTTALDTAYAFSTTSYASLSLTYGWVDPYYY